MPAIISPNPLRPSTPNALLPAPVDVPLPKPRCPQPSPRRRTKPYSPRRRTSPRAHRATDHHPFDQLPWLAALDATPSDLWDIADLSQLPESRPVLVARRLRPDLVQTPPPPPQRPGTPPCDTRVGSRPTTPLSRFIPSRVHFHSLMPVLRESVSGNAAAP